MSKQHRLSPEEYLKKQEIRKLENLKIYFGSRSNDFKKIVEYYLSRGNLKKEYLDVVLSDESWDLYGDAFTSDTVTNYFNEEKNKR